MRVYLLFAGKSTGEAIAIDYEFAELVERALK